MLLKNFNISPDIFEPDEFQGTSTPADLSASRRGQAHSFDQVKFES